MKCMIFAAGLGTRLKPLTNSMPKAMVPVNNKPLIDITLEKLIASGASEIVVNVHHFSEQIIEHITTREWEVPIKISDETSMLLDTGGGLKNALPLFTDDDTPILIHNVDILSNAKLENLYQALDSETCDAALLISKRKTSRYLLFDNSLNLKGWYNSQTGEIKSPYPNLDINKLQMLGFSGIHCFSPRLGDLMTEFPPIFSIIDFYLSVCAKVKIKGFMQSDFKMLDVGKLNSLAEAQEWFCTK